MTPVIIGSRDHRLNGARVPIFQRFSVSGLLPFVLLQNRAGTYQRLVYVGIEVNYILWPLLLAIFYLFHNFSCIVPLLFAELRSGCDCLGQLFPLSLSQSFPFSVSVQSRIETHPWLVYLGAADYIVCLPSWYLFVLTQAFLNRFSALPLGDVSRGRSLRGGVGHWCCRNSRLVSI